MERKEDDNNDENQSIQSIHSKTDHTEYSCCTDIASIKTAKRSNRSIRKIILDEDDDGVLRLPSSGNVDSINEDNGNLTSDDSITNNKSGIITPLLKNNTTDSVKQSGKKSDSVNDNGLVIVNSRNEATGTEECDKIVKPKSNNSEDSNNNVDVYTAVALTNCSNMNEESSVMSRSSAKQRGSSLKKTTMHSSPRKTKEAGTTTPITGKMTSKTTLLTLPCDAMHFIASFLSPEDWMSLSTTSVAANKVCLAVFRRVRLHGFRCATEVISSWVRGEHSDARELIALYVKNGVPIYPPCQGHTYSTLMWRMSVEAREMESTPEANNNNNDESGNNTQNNTTTTTTSNPALDRFYTDRYEARDRGVYFLPSLTYLEEKCLFWRYRLEEENSSSSNIVRSAAGGGRGYALPFMQLQPSTVVVNPQSREQQRNLSTSPTRQQHQFMYRASTAAAMRGKKKVVVKIHRHLANQHYLGHLTASDEDATGGISAGTISLSSDFFHDNGSYHDSLSTTKLVSNIITPNMILESDASTTALPAVFHSSQYPYHSSLPSMLPTSDTMLTDFILQVYNGTTNNQHDQPSCDDTDNAALQSRYDSYFLKLSNFLDHADSSAFEECILDFWDEFFPKTAGIHFFDKHTPVPRMSTLHSFLTKPCPKAIGIVQCEIERIRRSPTSKKSVKGRLFPTYEYRLFIRDRRTSDSFSESTSTDSYDISNRKDTVLMTARNRGKHHKADTATNNAASSSSTKRGVNNYYLYTNNKSSDDKTEQQQSKDLGRLQSNFIGTEFQIFSPEQSCNKKQLKINSSSDNIVPNNNIICVSSESEGENITDSTHQSKQFNNDHQSQAITTTPARNQSSSSLRNGKTKKRAVKLLRRPRSSRTSRRAIANSENSNNNDNTSNHNMSASAVEVEDGAITYTANLLGNRPRVMDVCIPRVNEDGSECEWRQYCRNNDLADGGSAANNNRMLSLFKQLQERLNNPEDNNEENNNATNNNNNDNNQELLSSSSAPTTNDHGLLCLQNRPPWWNFELGAFVLNFGGRVSVASVKNFQLCDRNDQEHIMLQFGRIQGRHSFTMDFQYPLTAVQAFAISISSLQSKISLG